MGGDALPGMKLGLDFGSNNLKIYERSKGIVLSELSVVICDKYSMEPVVMGNAASEMLDKLPGSMVSVYPIKDGIIKDYDIAKSMLKKYFDTVCAGRLLKPTVLMCVPSSVSELQKKTLFDLVTDAGAGRACFFEHALVSALGAGVSLTEPKGTFICDIGADTTDCAVVTMGNIAVSKSVKVGGNHLTKVIADYIFREHNIEVGADTADYIKRTVGTAIYRNEELAVIRSGKNRDTGLPVLFEITSSEVYWILKSYMEDILGCIKSVLEITPPELISDIDDTGIILSGGSSNLYGIDRFIEWSTGIITKRADSPEDCAVLGLGRLMKNKKALEDIGYFYVSPDDDYDDD